ncbi:hypothetical protein N9383_00060 [Granulosicoccus sp.]|nr:hypothetical protein [Granulosicoccus sp.]
MLDTESPVSLIKIFGERNTSTNALKLLIERNSESIVVPSTMTEIDSSATRRVEIMQKLGLSRKIIESSIDSVFQKVNDIYSWKHTMTAFEDYKLFDGIGVVVCVRDPSSWLLSLHDKPYHFTGRRPPEKFEDFLLYRWKTVRRERMSDETLTPIELYNKKMHGYSILQRALERIGNPVQVIRFEDFAHDQRSSFRSICSNLASPAADVEEITSSTKDPAKNADFYRHYYGEEQWKERISPDAANLIFNKIDWNVAARFGYTH